MPSFVLQRSRPTTRQRSNRSITVVARDRRQQVLIGRFQVVSPDGPTNSSVLGLHALGVRLPSQTMHRRWLAVYSSSSNNGHQTSVCFLSFYYSVVHRVVLEMGKNPRCLSSLLFRFYQISGFVRFGFGKNESSVRVRFFLHSLRFSSVRFDAGPQMNTY